MNQSLTSIRSSHMMLSADGEKHSFALGMIWQPLSVSTKQGAQRQVRDLARSFGCSSHVMIRLEGTSYVGLLQDDPLVRKDGRKSKITKYSMAAQLALTFPGESLVFLWDMGKAETFAVIVLNNGAPVIDIVLHKEQALTTLDEFVGRDNQGSFRVVGNVLDSLNGWSAEPFDLSNLQITTASKLIDIPVNLKFMAITLSVISVLVFSVFYGSYLWKEHARQERLAALDLQKDIEAYRAALDLKLQNLGMTSDHFIGHVDSLSKQPFVSSGWLLKEIVCKSGSCKSTWSSEGGYTKELISFLQSQRPVINERDFKRISFTFREETKQSGVAGTAELKDREWVKQYLFEEQQAWSKAGLRYKIDLQGKDLVPGFERVPKSQKVLEFPLQLSGSKDIVQNFVSAYGNLIYWHDIEIEINPNTSINLVEVTVKGSIYGK